MKFQELKEKVEKYVGQECEWLDVFVIQIDGEVLEMEEFNVCFFKSGTYFLIGGFCRDSYDMYRKMDRRGSIERAISFFFTGDRLNVMIANA